VAVWLAVWQARREPDAHARRCASDAVDAIDPAIAELRDVCARLVAEIRESDDVSTARPDELLRDGVDPPGPKTTA
jgi:hypothetical protein